MSSKVGDLTTLSPYVISGSANKLTVIGCAEIAMMVGNFGLEDNSVSGCLASCSTFDDALKQNGTCSGLGCCQTSIPYGLRNYLQTLNNSYNYESVSSFSPCEYAFFGDKDKYTFNVADFSDPTLATRVDENVPIVFEWFVDLNETCLQAKRNSSSYACQQNSYCVDFNTGARGYRCKCLPGYEGNPYLPPGCRDIDECKGATNPCSKTCTNTVGNYTCTCPYGYDGDGLKSGTGCTMRDSQFVTRLSLGMSFGFLFLLMSTSWMYFTIKRKKLKKKREQFFGQNGGNLLQKLLTSDASGETADSSKIFSTDELSVATKNYSENRVLGKGGFGTVYKGILKDGREVAIKKSKLDDQSEYYIKEFINEVATLTQIKHRNVVKLIGCCLETEVPLLVYEFISNGTLEEHICVKGDASWLDWENCVRVAAEAAGALAYLHSSVSTPIIHRDVKTANILLDKSFTVKIADFGASRPASIDQIQVATKLPGTFGYVDPESFMTCQLTEKSDVYSFGVVLAELLTKERAMFLERKMGEDSLARYFVKCMKNGRVIEIIDPQLVREASEEQLVTIANIVKRSLSLKGDNRPTMREVALEL